MAQTTLESNLGPLAQTKGAKPYLAIISTGPAAHR
jgi:hypothetical protein